MYGTNVPPPIEIPLLNVLFMTTVCMHEYLLLYPFAFITLGLVGIMNDAFKK